jgi:hypothetical protein
LEFEHQKTGPAFIFSPDGNSSGSNPDGSGHCHVLLQLVAVKMIWVSTLDFVQRKSGPSTDRWHLGFLGKFFMQKTRIMATWSTLIIKTALRGLQRIALVKMLINKTDTQEKGQRKKQKYILVRTRYVM